MHSEDEQVEITKVVVGPMDKNVFVVRCRETGDAVMLDAANEHDKLLDLCKRLNVRMVLETNGHWAHIPAAGTPPRPCPRSATPATRSASPPRTRRCSRRTTSCSRTTRSSRSATYD